MTQNHKLTVRKLNIYGHLQSETSEFIESYDEIEALEGHICEFVYKSSPFAPSITLKELLATEISDVIMYCTDISSLTPLRLPDTPSYDKMIRRELYYAADKELERARVSAKIYCQLYNNFPYNLIQFRQFVLSLLIDSPNPWIETGVNFDYGINFKTGSNFYANHNFTVLDCGLVNIGDNCLVGPNVTFVGGTHPNDLDERKAGLEYGVSISVGSNVWFGAGAIVLGGCTIGDNVIVGANSFVKSDIPSNCIVVGSPAKIVKLLN